jgi:hypothetical protein
MAGLAVTGLLDMQSVVEIEGLGFLGIQGVGENDPPYHEHRNQSDEK